MTSEIKMKCNKCHKSMNGTTVYDGSCECGGLIKVDDRPDIQEFIDNEIKTFHEMRAKIQRPTNDKDIGFLRCLEYIKSNIEKGNIRD